MEAAYQVEVEQAPGKCHLARDYAHQGIDLLLSTLDAAPPEKVEGSDAMALAALFAEIERIAAAGKALYARRVKETAAYQAAGHRNAAVWLATVSKDPVSRARGVFEIADQVVKTSALRAAFSSGELSTAQAAIVGPAAALRPGAVPELLKTARLGTFRQMKDLASRTKRIARGEPDQQARDRRLYSRRFCRIWHPASGGIRIDAWLTAVDGARVVSCLERETNAVFDQCWAGGVREPPQSHRADALVRLVCREELGSRPRPRAQVVVRVDAAALRRQSLADGEVCEIAGVGPVSLATARELLGDCWLNLLVKDGIDLTTVTTTRTIRPSLRVALGERDPTCVVPGCSISDHLQIYRWSTGSDTLRPAFMSDLSRVCPRHHAMITHHRWSLGGGPGKWRWVPPPPLRT